MASDYLLEIDGIKGESQDAKHKETVEVSSFSWGLSNSGTAGHGTGQGSGKANFQDFHFTTSVSKASPALGQRCATGEPIKKATLYVRKQGKDQQDFYTLLLEDFIVSSYQSGGSGDGVPHDQFSFNYVKIKFDYKAQKDDGTLAGPVSLQWNTQKNAKT